jgi:protein involved in polysaccharide export with SLBB domain
VNIQEIRRIDCPRRPGISTPALRNFAKTMIHTGYKLLVLTAAVFLMEAAGALAYEGPETSQERCAAYPLGPNDQIGVRGMNGEQINETLTVGADNEITVPLIGRMAVGGLTVEELQGKLNKLLKEYIQDPNVAVTLAAPQSRRVSIVGAVNQPGVHPIRGCTTIMEAISQAGGLRTDAGNAIKITRSGTPANQERSGAARPATKSDFEVIDLRVSDLLEAKRPENNVMLQPGDVVSARANGVCGGSGAEAGRVRAERARDDFGVAGAFPCRGTGVDSLSAIRPHHPLVRERRQSRNPGKC